MDAEMSFVGAEEATQCYPGVGSGAHANVCYFVVLCSCRSKDSGDRLKHTMIHLTFGSCGPTNKQYDLYL